MTLEDTVGLQLLIGLNLAIFTFSELRAPAVARLKSERDSIDYTLRSMHEDLLAKEVELLKNPSADITAMISDLCAEATELRSEAQSIIMGFHSDDALNRIFSSSDRSLRTVAVLVAIIDLGALFWASVAASREIPIYLFTTLVAASTLPIVISIGLNLLAHFGLDRLANQLKAVGKRAKEADERITRVRAAIAQAVADPRISEG